MCNCCLCPCGRSGLKHLVSNTFTIVMASLPLWAEWIETHFKMYLLIRLYVSTRSGEVDLSNDISYKRELYE